MDFSIFTEARHVRRATVVSAILSGDTRALRRRIARGASISIYDSREWTPLHEAVNAKQYECVRILLDKLGPEDVNAQTEDDETPIFLAAKAGLLKTLRLLIKHGGDPNIICFDGDSPLLQAVMGNHEKCVAYLLKKGADVNSHLEEGWSALNEAASRGFSKILLLLLKAGAKTDTMDKIEIRPVYGAFTNAIAHDYATPLYLAAQNGHSQCVKYLLDYGASVDIPTNTFEGFRAIHAAACGGHLKTLELLIPPSLSVLEQVNLRSQWDEVLTPLQLAAKGGHNEAVKMLLAAGCDPDCGIRNPSTENKDILMTMAQAQDIDPPPFFCATEKGHYTTAKMLLDSGATICQSSDSYCLPSMFFDDTRALELLLDHGAEVDCKHFLTDLCYVIKDDCSYLACLMNRGLRVQFNCGAKQGLCLDTSDGDMLTSEVVCAIKVISCYVDRLNFCQHTTKSLQEQGGYDEIALLTGKIHSLQHLSRVAITEHMGTIRAVKIIPTLDFLPSLIKDYLLYKDVYSDTVEDKR